MFNTALTYLQIFGIGFSFGFAGPCFLFCTPVLITYLLGRSQRWQEASRDIVIFLIGRLLAYVLLGALAGASGAILRRFINPSAAVFISPLSGAVSIILGVFVLIYKDPVTCACASGPARKIYGYGSLFTLGFILGVSPCAPLTALLLEIALMSKSAIEGASYTFFFGLGTLLSGIIVIGALAGIIGGLAKRLVKSKVAATSFRIACAGFLILLGTWLIVTGALFRTPS
jgi:thiol:disulfide interchange protein DsbD